MGESEITSPPYPSQVATARGLYRALGELRAWGESAQADVASDLKRLADRAFEEGKDKESASMRDATNGLFTPMPTLAAETVWLAGDVSNHFVILSAVQQIREAWDAILREYEDAWGTRGAVRRRLHIVRSARNVLDAAFVSPEVREMQAEKLARQYAKARQVMQKHWMRAMQSEDDDGGNDDPDGPEGAGNDEEWV